MSRLSRIPLAWLNLTHNRVRMLVFCAGIGFAVVLMFVQYGCKNALLDSSVLLLDKLRTDLVVINKLQTTILLRTPFSRHVLARAPAVPGVQSVHPLYLEGMASPFRDADPDVQKRDPSQPIRVVGVDPDAYLLDFNALKPDSPQSRVDQLRLEGRALFDKSSKRGDRPRAFVYGPVRVGSESDVAGQRILVVGFFKLGIDFGNNGTLIVSNDTFHRYLRPMSGMDQVDVGLIRLSPNADRHKVKRELQAYLGSDGVQVLTKEEFKAHEQQFWMDNTPIGYVFGFGMGMGFIVGLVICYQILSTDIRDNLPAYATLRAIGYSNAYVARVVIEEAVLLAVLGFLPGLLFSWLAYVVLAERTDLPMEMTPYRIAFIFLLTVVMCVASGLLAVTEAMRAEPAEVF